MYKAQIYRFSVTTAILLYIFLSPFTQCSRITYKVIIPASQIRQNLQKKFPKSKIYSDIVKITLSDPSLLLGNSRNRLTIGLNVKITQPLTEIIINRGRLVLSSGLKFNDSTAEFLFNKVKTDSINLDMGNLNREIQEGIKEVMSSMVRESVENSSLYRMKPGTVKTRIARLFIRKVRIYKEGVEVTLGI